MPRPIRCKALTKLGNPCGWTGPVLDTPDGPRCPAHDPSRREEWRTRAKLGAARSAAVRGQPAPRAVPDWPLPHGGPPGDADECDAVASWALHAVATGTLDVKVSREIAVMINAKLRAQKEGKLAERVRELETMLVQLQASAPKKEH